MNERDIIETLQKALMAAMFESVMPDLPVKYFGRNWEIPNDQKWIEPLVIPGETVETWGAEKTYRGLFRLILHWPKDDAGVYEPLAILGSVAGYFTKDRPLQNLRIYETATLAGMIDGGAEALYPANMRYHSFGS